MKNSKQKIKVTIHQTKIVSSVVVPFYMKLKINEVYQISDQISEKLFDYNKNFIFELNTSNFESTTLEVVVLSKSRVIFDYEVGKIFINFNQIFLNEEKNEWYIVKNTTDDNVFMLQISIGILTNSQMKNLKQIESEVKPKLRVNHSIDETNFSKKIKPNIPKKLNNTSNLEKMELDDSQSSNLDKTVVFEESCKSPDISNICSEFFSPKTKTDQDKVYLNQTSVKDIKKIDKYQHNLSTNNCGNLDIQKLSDINNLFTISNENELDIEKTSDFLQKLKKKKLEMKEKEKKLLKEQENFVVIKEKLRDRESKLILGNKILEKDIEQIHNDKNNYENLLKSYNNRIQRNEYDILKRECQKDLILHEKEMFFTINNLINSNNFIDNHQKEIILDNISSGLLFLKSKNNLNDFTPLFDHKKKKLFKRYNTDHNLSVYKSNTKLNSFNNITVLESSEDLKPLLIKKDSAKLSEKKSILHSEQFLCNIKEIDETETINVEKNTNTNLYNFNQMMIQNTNISNDNNNSINHKKIAKNLDPQNEKNKKLLNNTINQNKVPIKIETNHMKNKDLSQIDNPNLLNKSNNLSYPFNMIIQKNIEFVMNEKNKLKNNLLEKRRISEDKKIKIDIDFQKKKNLILKKTTKENITTIKKSPNQTKINSKNLSGNSNQMSTNNSSINSVNAANQKSFLKSVKKVKYSYSNDIKKL